MGEYLTPGVYTENKKNGYRPIESVSTTTGAFIGVALRGKVGQPTYITSWSDYIRNFANGLESPFMAGSDLAYAVQGFFKNGGRRCFILRVDDGTSVCASLTISEDVKNEEEINIEALDEGDWGNEISITITENTDIDDSYDVRIEFQDVIEPYTSMSNDPKNERYFASYINKRSSLVHMTDGKMFLMPKTNLIGGVTGNDNITDVHYMDVLEKFNSIIEDVNLLAIPGQNSIPMQRSLLDYCARTGEVFPVLSMPPYLDVMELKAIRKELTGVVGAVYDPWVKVIDPISTTVEYREVPPEGHIMGVIARTIIERGTHKAPAGVDADIRGIVGLTTHRTVGGVLGGGETDLMNPVGINAIIAKPNYGTVVWGARTLNNDSNFRYVSDELFNIMIKKSIRNGTQWVVFEPNFKNAPMWRQAKTTVRAYLYTLWKKGQLAGNIEDEAYWIQIDEENNPQEEINNGFFHIDFGYAPTKPAEFVVIRIQHGIVTS